MTLPMDRRAQLLSRIVEALLERGAADLSLRPLAERVGTSARLLISARRNSSSPPPWPKSAPISARRCARALPKFSRRP